MTQGDSDDYEQTDRAGQGVRRNQAPWPRTLRQRSGPVWAIGRLKGRLWRVRGMAAHPSCVNAMLDVNRNEVVPVRFGVPPHIHVCVTGTGTVILDVRRDRYLGLGREDTELLVDAVPGWPIPLWQQRSGRDAHAILQATNELCESLAADGVLERIP